MIELLPAILVPMVIEVGRRALKRLFANESRAIRELVELGAPRAEPLDFTEFFTEFAPRLHRWIARRCSGDRTTAEDLVQEVFTQAWKDWDKVGRYENPHAWVFLVARQLVQRYQRSLKKSAAIELPELHDNRTGGTDSLVDFTRALPQLPLDQRKAAFLVFVLEYTPAEAAQVLGLNGSTLRSHLRRARLQIARDHLLDPPGPALSVSEEGGR